MVQLNHARGLLVKQTTRFKHVRESIRLVNKDALSIFLIHGLGRTSRSMRPIGRAIAKEFPEAKLHYFDYRSRHAAVDQHAELLERFIEESNEGLPTCFIAHSLGNIVLRRVYRRWQERGYKLPNLFGHIMLGPPNQGSQFAKRVIRIPGLRTIMGRSFEQLGRDWSLLAQSLTLPPCPFIVLAGAPIWLERLNPIVRGANDGLVRVSETMLPESYEHRVMPVSHTMMLYPSAQKAVIESLKRLLELRENGSNS